MERGGGTTITSGNDNDNQPPPPPSDQPLDPALLPEGEPDVEIESLIIPALEALHTAHIREAGQQGIGDGAAAAGG